MSPVIEALYRVKRGLAGYVSYLAACEMNESFSEYILYEPTLRILTAQGYTVSCEVHCPGFTKVGAGDFKKLDFVAESSSDRFAIEMKWARESRLRLGSDFQKLSNFVAAAPENRGFLCIFGRRSAIEGLSLTPTFSREQGKPVYAEFGVTRFGCRIFEITSR